MFAPLLDVEASFRVGRRKGFCTLLKVSKKGEGFATVSKTLAGVGHLKRICKDAFCLAGVFIRDVRRSGRWFPERGCILEHQIFRFAKMILRERCCSSYDLASLFCGARSTLDSHARSIFCGKSQNALVRGCQHCTHLSIFESRIASLLMLPT